MKKSLFAIFFAALTLVGCTSKKNVEEEASQPKILVLYYSQTGATKSVAEEIQKQLEADIEALELEVPYDGTFEQTIERCQKEKAENVLPVVKPIKANLDDYDVVFLGYPIWFGTFATPIAGLINNQKFAGKKIVTFCTFGSGGLQSSTEQLVVALPDAQVVEGYGVRNARLAAMPGELNRFLIERGFKEGEVEALPAFMEHHPVSADEVAVFDQACADYQFPLGIPFDVAVRESATCIDYEFSANASGKEADGATATIYVTVGKEAGAKPEFTQVVR